MKPSTDHWLPRRRIVLGIVAVTLVVSATAIEAGTARWTEVVAVAGLVFLLVAGAYLWTTSSDWRAKREEVGRGLLVSALVAASVAWIQIAVNQRLTDIEEQRERSASRLERERRASDARQSLQLTIGLQSRLPGIDLSHRAMESFYLVDKDLRRANLRGAILNRANLARANLSGATLDGAHLQSAILRRSLAGASLRGADLREADLTRARLFEARRTKSGKVFYLGADLRGAELFATRFFGADLRGANLRGTGVAGMDADCVNFEGADLAYGGGGGWVATGLNLHRANLEGARLSRFFLNPSQGSRCKHENDLRYAIFANADLRAAHLFGVRLGGATFERADLRFANLACSNTSPRTRAPKFIRIRGLGEGSRVAGGVVVFIDADLRGADLRGMDLENAWLFGAKYDAQTRWPDGFDPEAAEAVRAPRASFKEVTEGEFVTPPDKRPPQCSRKAHESEVVQTPVPSRLSPEQSSP